jgi:serine/threonine protein kinase
MHRDVKPSNILLIKNEHLILVDFGLATGLSKEFLPELGADGGTPAYMPPAQTLGQRVDGRTDIYSLGIIFYDMLCGQHPFSDSVVRERLRRVRDEEPTPPRHLVPQVPRELELICLKAMAKPVSERYTTGADLAADLRRYLEGSPITASPRWSRDWAFSPFSPTQMRREASWIAFVLIALVASAILAGLLWLVFFFGRGT